MPVSIKQAIDIALQHHQARRFGDAERIYRQILAAQPNNADAMHLLGAVALEAGRFDLAVQLMQRAIAVNPNVAVFHGNLGEAQRRARKFEPALESYRRAVALDPKFTPAYSNMGIVLRDLGRLDEAVAACRKALEIDPDFVDAYNNLGNALSDQKQFDEALAAYRRAIALRPQNAEAYGNMAVTLSLLGQPDAALASLKDALAINPNDAAARGNLGSILCDQGQFDAGISELRRSIALSPNNAEPHSSLGNALREKGQFAESLTECDRALAIKPDYPEAHNNRANALTLLNRLDEAIDEYRKAVRLRPNYADAFSNLGNALREKGSLDEAIAACKQAIALKADYAEAHGNLSLVHLSRGEFEIGWKEYEWRWKFKTVASRNFSQPQWDGRDLQGKTILLHAEQGLGDTIHFVRYAPMVAARGGRVILECQTELRRLLEGFPGVDRMVSAGDELPEFDWHCPLLSLPLAFGTNLQNIPVERIYLKAIDSDVQKWAGRFDGDGLRVGVVWAGQPKHKNDHNRSIRLAQLAPLAQVKGIRFYSLQKGAGAAQAANPPQGMNLIDFSQELTDFADTAALMSQLDLIVSVDTAPVHLATALGKPVWVLLPFAPDWRWLLEREDSPWYPTVRLFRQKSYGQWNETINRVARELGRWHDGEKIVR